MSDVVAVALITGLITGAVGIAGIAFSAWNSAKERDLRLAERQQDYSEWYRRTLFEKRLNAAQEAYSWIMKLNRYASLAKPNAPAERRAEYQELERQARLDAREWYDNNAIFLYDDLPRASQFIGLINTDAHDDDFAGQMMRAFDEVRARLKQLLAPTHTDGKEVQR